VDTKVDAKKTVLIVDDSEFVRSYHSYILEQAQFQVITAVDGSDGLEKLYTNACDLVLTDINMSNMDGYEFIRRVRADEKYGSLPIIIVSTESETGLVPNFETNS
jgi:two-component system chemotaxis response regulator CheY